MLQAAADKFGWKPMAGSSKRGFGVACGIDAGTYVASIAEVKVNKATGEVRAGNPVAIARGLLLAAHGFVLSAHTMVDDRAGEDELDAELTVLLTRALAP